MTFIVIGNAIAIVNAPPIIIQNQYGIVSFGLLVVVLGVVPVVGFGVVSSSPYRIDYSSNIY